MSLSVYTNYHHQKGALCMNIPLNQSSGLLPPEPSGEAGDLSVFPFYLLRKNMAAQTIRV